MAYSPASIGSTGLISPTYADIRDFLVAQFLAIFGATSYLGIDSPDYQDIATRALQAFDTNQALQTIYLSMNPQTAIGTSLDMLGRLIGTARKTASYSTALVTLTGSHRTTIVNGVVRDVNGKYWNLASPITIGVRGRQVCLATAQQIGTVTADIGEITTIATPCSGWVSVTNDSAATPGDPVESDAVYRARLLISQAKPSITMHSGTAAAIAAVDGVTRSVVYENAESSSCGFGVVNTYNSTGSPAVANLVELVVGYPFHSSQVGKEITFGGAVYVIASVISSTLATVATSPGDQTGVAYHIGDGVSLGPAHSISCVTEGGLPSDVAQAIYNNRGLGCYTDGTTSIVVTDTDNSGASMTIRFYELSYTPIYVTLSVRALTGFTSATQDAIQTGIVNYLNSLGIGESVVYSELFGAALTARPDPDHPLFSIHSIAFGDSASPTSTNDVPIDFSSASVGQTGNVIVNLV